MRRVCAHDRRGLVSAFVLDLGVLRRHSTISLTTLPHAVMPVCSQVYNPITGASSVGAATTLPPTVHTSSLVEPATVTHVDLESQLLAGDSSTPGEVLNLNLVPAY